MNPWLLIGAAAALGVALGSGAEESKGEAGDGESAETTPPASSPDPVEPDTSPRSPDGRLDPDQQQRAVEEGRAAEDRADRYDPPDPEPTDALEEDQEETGTDGQEGESQPTEVAPPEEGGDGQEVPPEEGEAPDAAVRDEQAE